MPHKIKIKNKVIIIEISAIIAASISLYILGISPKAFITVGALTVFLSWAMLDPPTKHRQFTEEDIVNFRGPFAKSSVTPQIIIEKEKGGKFSIKRWRGQEVKRDG